MRARRPVHWGLLAGMLVAAVLVPSPARAAAATLAGEATTGPSVDTDGAGLAEAFRTTAAASGTVATLNVFLDASSQASGVSVGLYSDAGGHPGTLLTRGTISAPGAGRWNAVTVTPTGVAAGSTYWLAMLGTGGTLAFRDHCCGGGTPAENSSQSTLTALPATWSSGPRWSDGPASIYAADATTPPDPSQVGQWSPLMDWGMVAAHSVLLHSGKLLEMAGWVAPNPTKLFDPATGSLTTVTNPFGLDIFCSGNATLPDGRVVVAGGHGFTGTIGIDATSIFDPVSQSWTAGPRMASARWYPTLTELGDGRLVAISGNVAASTWADTPEVYDPGTNAWTSVSGISTSEVHEEEYPLSYLLPDGRIFVVASSVKRSFVLDANGPTWSPLGGTTAVDNGSAVMYRPGKLLYSGGGGPLNSTAPAQRGAQTIDLTSANPSWQATSPMNAARYAHTLTMLPDGQVLAVGGGTNLDQTDVSGGELSAETWDPQTGNWTTVAPADVPRVYHSTAVLLPDGRVLVGGGGAAESTASPGEPNAQFYSPPYLFKGPRPAIANVPSTGSYGGHLQVDTPDPSSIGSVALVSLGADTHTLDMNQHFVPLSFTRGTSAIDVSLPASASVAPPGYYMLFVVNTNGVPAVAPMVQITRGTSVPAVAITAPAGGTVSGSAVTLSATATDPAGIASVQLTVDGVPVGSPVKSPPYTTTWDSTIVPNGSHTLAAIATNTAGAQATATPVTVTVANVSTTATPPSVDAQVPVDGKGAQTTPSLTTTQPGDVLVAFTTSDGPGTAAQTMTVTGAGLTWSLVRRVNAQSGTTEIWTAKAPAALSGVSVTSTPARTGYSQSLTVVAFRGAKGVGASATANARTGAPTVGLTTTAAGSLVYGAGNDYDRAVARTPGAGQAIMHQWLDTATGDTYWVQRVTAASVGAGAAATISDTAPTTDRWNLAAVEIVPG